MVWDQQYLSGDFLSDDNSNNIGRDAHVHAAGFQNGLVFHGNEDGIASSRICGSGLLRKLGTRKSNSPSDRSKFPRRPASIDNIDGKVESEAITSPYVAKRKQIQSSNCSTTHLSSHISSKSSSSSSSRSNRLQELSLQRDTVFDPPNKTYSKSKHEAELFGFDRRDEYNYLSLSRGYASIPDDDHSDVLEREVAQSSPLFQLHTRPTSPESTTSSISEFSVPKVILQFDPTKPFALDNSINATHNTVDLSNRHMNSTETSSLNSNFATAASTTSSALMQQQCLQSFDQQQIEKSVSHLQTDHVLNQHKHLFTCNNSLSAVRLSPRHHHLMSRGSTLPAVLEETNSFDSDENTNNKNKPDRESIDAHMNRSRSTENVLYNSAPSSTELETAEHDKTNIDNNPSHDVTLARLPASISPHSSSIDSNNDTSRGKQEIIAAMKELVTRQQETIRDLCDENLKYRDQILWFRDDIKKFKAEKHDFQQNLITLLVEKQEYEAEIQHSKQEVEKLKISVKDIRTYLDTDILKQFESWLKTTGGVVGGDQTTSIVSNDKTNISEKNAITTNDATAIKCVAPPETQSVSATTKAAATTSSLQKHLPHSFSSSSSLGSRKKNQESRTIDDIVSTFDYKAQTTRSLKTATKDVVVQDDDEDDDDDEEEEEEKHLKLRCNSSSSLESFDEQISQKWNELVASEKQKQTKQSTQLENEISVGLNSTKVNPTANSSGPAQSIKCSSSSCLRSSSIVRTNTSVQDQVRSSSDSIHDSRELQERIYRSNDDYSAMTATTNNRSSKRNQLLEYHDNSIKSTKDPSGAINQTVATASMSKNSAASSMKSDASERQRTARKKDDSSMSPSRNDDTAMTDRYEMTNNSRSFAHSNPYMLSSMSTTTSSISSGVYNDDGGVGGGCADDGRRNISGWGSPEINDKSPLHLSSFLIATATLSSPSPPVPKLEPPGILSSPSVLSESISFATSSPDVDIIKSRLGTIQRRRLRRQKERIGDQDDTMTKGSRRSGISNDSKSTTSTGSRSRSQVVRFSE